MQYITARCPNCGKKLFSYYEAESRYGCPVKTCKKCNTKYLDPRYHEIAIDGISKDSMSHVKGIILLIVGALIVYRGIQLTQMHMLGTPDEAQWVFPTMILILGSVTTILGIADIISILTGIKARKFERLRQESEERMQNYNYVQLLRSLGYPVPEKFL